MCASRFHRTAAAVAAAMMLAIGEVGTANVQYNFNSTAEGWEFGTILPLSGTTPYWEYHKEPSATDGALRALLVESGSGAGAWAMSPCLEVFNTKDVIHVDISHWTAFPPDILGQMQLRIDATGTSGWGPWQGISGTAWYTYANNHVPPDDPNVFPPLLSSSGTANLWLAFSGTHNPGTDPDASSSTGQHVNSAFDIALAEYGLSEGSEIQFRFVVGVNTVFPTQSPETVVLDTVLWEVNDVQIYGVKECVVPEPGTLALAGFGAAAAGGMCLRRRRAGRHRSFQLQERRDQDFPP